MKNFKSSILVLIIAVLLSACSTHETPSNSVVAGNAYIFNYGNFTGTKGEVSLYSTTKDSISNGYFNQVNGRVLSSNIQYAYALNDKIYMIGNNKDQLLWVDKSTMEQSSNGITDSLVVPRFCIAQNNYIWISCYGSNDYYLNNASASYLAKFNINTGRVEKKIPLSGGPEGLAIKDGKLYVALNYARKIAVIDLTSEAISYITTPSVTSYFIQDNKNNLYVSLVSTYGNSSDNVGLALINTQNNTIENTYLLPNLSSGYTSVMYPSNDKTKFYLIASIFDVALKMNVGAIQVFDTQTKQFSPFIAGVNGINGVAVDPNNDQVYCLIAESFTGLGKINIYNSKGDYIGEQVTGIAPGQMIFIK